MNIFNRNNLLRIGAFLSGAVLLASCSDWTETESVNIKNADIKTDNPELYAQYLESLQDYRSSDHKVVIAKFDNLETAPAGQAEHINALPDSVDYVILKNPDNLSEVIQSEMVEVRADKGMKVLYEISYTDLVALYKAYVEEWNIAHMETSTEEGETTTSDPSDTLISQYIYVNEAVQERVALFEKYGYDGINVSYTGINPLIYTDETLPQLDSLQESFFDPLKQWRQSNPDALVFFEGTPQYLTIDDGGLVSGAEYIILDGTSATSSYEYSYLVQLALRLDNIPSDRFVMGVTTASLEDDGSTDGTSADKDDDGNTLTAITNAAYWINAVTSGFTKCGICIDNAQNDYYNIQFVYPNVRKAIAIMNPSPLN